MTQHILQPYPYYTWPAINPSNSLNPLLKNPTTGEPLKVIVYTRGNTGRGRTMKNEELLVNQLKQYGANVFYCCNFDKVNITQQLYYAYEADVVRETTDHHTRTHTNIVLSIDHWFTWCSYCSWFIYETWCNNN